MKKRTNSTYFLGRSIGQEFPFERVPIYTKQPIKPQKEIITTRFLVLFGIIVAIKIIILLLWI